MLVVSENQIYLTRGDTLTITLSLTNDDGSAYVPDDSDKIYFRLKKFAATTEILVEKEINVSNMILQLNENDTKNLPFGDYRYEIELVKANGSHYTVIENELFTIGKELENHVPN